MKDVSINRIARRSVFVTYSYQEFLFYHEKRDSQADLEFMTSDSESTTCVSLITLKPQNYILVAVIAGKLFTDLP